MQMVMGCGMAMINARIQNLVLLLILAAVLKINWMMMMMVLSIRLTIAPTNQVPVPFQLWVAQMVMEMVGMIPLTNFPKNHLNGMIQMVMGLAINLMALKLMNV